MAARWGLGPVFAADCMTSSRRWQVYAARSMLVGSVLVVILVMWLDRYSGVQFISIRRFADAGSAVIRSIMELELVLALAIVPAVTAGAICQDKMRGGLSLMMVTDLSDAEIVLGRLASRLVTVLGVIACGLPVLAILTSLGGVDPVDILTGTMVIVGVAVLGACLSLTFSVRATRPHEALIATYATFGVWLLALLAWSTMLRGVAGPPSLLQFSNPFWLLYQAEWEPLAASPFARLGFLAGTLVISTVLTAMSIRQIRAVTLRQASRPVRISASRSVPGGHWFARFGLPDASLEDSPVLWRELFGRQPSSWVRATWGLYGALSVFFTVTAIFVNSGITAPGVSAFIVSIGLLLVSVHAATSLAEERAHGSLDVLLSTPLSTRSIVLGKWWWAFRPVPKIAVLPGLIAFHALAVRSDVLGAVIYSVLTTALTLAYGAFFASLGLAIATCQPRLGRAVGFSVAAFLTATIIYPAILISTTRLGGDQVLLLWVSPFFGLFWSMGWICWIPSPSWFPTPSWVGGAIAMFFWAAVTAAAAGAIRTATVRSFDRLMGRVSESPGHPRHTPEPKSLGPQSLAPHSGWD
jgi:ABC-type transport system involved in multi-copper enzyme maturation permease subunit